MFQVILSSNSSLNNYPSNSGGCFHADLNETLHFNKFSWEVALSELFIVPNSWYLIREPFNYFYFRVSKLQMERLVLDSTYIRYDLKYKGGRIVVADLHGKEYASERTFKDYHVFSAPIRDSPKSRDVPHHYVYYYVWTTYMAYEHEFKGEIPPGAYSAKDLLAVIIKQGADFFKSVIEKMKTQNIVFVNLDDNHLIENATKETIINLVEHSDGKLEIILRDDYASKFNMQLKLSSQINYILGFTEYLYQPEIWCAACKGVVAPKAIVNTLTNLYVFCDFIAPMFFNDKQIPLLQQVDCSESLEQIQHETFSNLLFKDISKTSINTIKIWLSEYACGYPIFETHSPSTVILVFRSI